MQDDMMGVRWLAAQGEFMPEELPNHGELSLNFTSSTDEGESSELIDSIGEGALADLWALIQDEEEPSDEDGWDFL